MNAPFFSGKVKTTSLLFLTIGFLTIPLVPVLALHDSESGAGSAGAYAENQTQAIFEADTICCTCQPTSGAAFPVRFDRRLEPLRNKTCEQFSSEGIYNRESQNICTAAQARIQGSVCHPTGSCPPITNPAGSLCDAPAAPQPVDEGTANFRSLEPVLSVPIPGVSFSPATLSNGEVSVPFLAQYILGIYRFAIGAAAILASIMVVYGGFRYLLGSTLGDVKEGKTVIQNAVIGLIVLLCSYVILQSVNPDLVTLKALRLSYQERMLEPEAEHMDNGGNGSGGGGSGSNGGPSGYGIPDNTSPSTRPTNLELVAAPDTECMHLNDGQVNAQLVEPLRRAGEIFCRLRASVSGGGAWRIKASDTSRTMRNQLSTWFSNGCNTNPNCTATCSPFAPGYTPPPGVTQEEAAQHLGDPMQCPHTSGVALDLFCDGTPGQSASRPHVHPYVPCQLLLERAMLEAGFCRLRQESWHFELNAIRKSGTNCNNNPSEIVGKIQTSRTEPVYDYSPCTASWNYDNRAHETCSRIAPSASPAPSGSTGASLPAPRRALPEASAGITGSQFALQLLGITDPTVGANVLNLAKNGNLTGAAALIPRGSRPMSETARENAIVEAINANHYPAFLSQFIAINVTAGSHTGTFFVAPDMLSVGTNADYLRVPMSARSAQQIATHFGLLLPTKKMIDAMLHASNVQKEVMVGQAPFDGDRSHTLLYVKTNKLIQDQRNAHFDSSLRTAYIGGKKNVVIAPEMSRPRAREGHTCPDLRVWIYGGLHSASASDITQEPTSVHDEGYFDYSHGINLISAEMIVDNNPMRVSEVLANRELAPLISDDMNPLHVSPVILDPRYPVSGPIEVCS